LLGAWLQRAPFQMGFIMKSTAGLGLLIVVAFAIAPTGACAQSTDMKGMDMKGMAMDKTAAASHKGIGIVKNINAADGTVTLAHEPIKSLNWPAMTMAFKVKDKKLIDNVAPGSKVDFTLVQSGKDYVITSIK
jgi:Cu(I)/Ag(I) efflux system periplasmic protein CusF